MPSSLPFVFLHHPKFVEELDSFICNHCSGTATSEETIRTLQNLLSKHFCEGILQFTPKHISFLCLDSHVTNYSDSKLRSIAQKRLLEILNLISFKQP